MADFKELLEEQKKTTAAINKLTIGSQKSQDKQNKQGKEGEKRERTEAQKEADKQRSIKMSELHAKKGADSLEKGAESDKETEKGDEETRTLLQKISFGLLGNKLKEKEDQKDETGFRKRSLTALMGIGSRIGDMAKSMYGKAAAKVKDLGSILKKMALVALIPLVIAFFNSESWELIKNMIKDHLIPGLETLYHKILKPIGIWFMEGLGKFIKDFDAVLNGEKGWISLLKENWEIMGAIALLLLPKTLGLLAIKGVIGVGTALKGSLKWAFKLLRLFLSKDLYMAIWNLASTAAKGAGKLMITAVAKVGKALTALQVFLNVTLYKKIFALAAGGIAGAGGMMLRAVGSVGKAMTALRLFMTVSLLPMISGMLAGILPLAIAAAPIVAVAALVALTLASLWNAFKDFKCTLEETGSIFTAIKVGFASFIANMLGIIPNLILDLISWIFKKFGWTEWAATLDEIDVVSFIKNGLITVFDKLGEWIGLLYTNYIEPLLEPLVTFFDPVIESIKSVFDWLIGIIQPVIDVVNGIKEKVGKTFDKLKFWKWGKDDEGEEITPQQLGGPISKGKPYLVGEAGPELIMPSGSGKVIPAGRTAAIMDSGAHRGTGGGNTVVAPMTNNMVNTTQNTSTETIITDSDVFHSRLSSYAI